MFSKSLLVMVILCVGFVCSFIDHEGLKSLEENTRRRRDGSVVAPKSGFIWDKLNAWKDSALIALKKLITGASESDQLKAIKNFVLAAKDKVVEHAKGENGIARTAAHKAAEKLKVIAETVKIKAGETAHAAAERVKKLVDDAINKSK